MDYVLQHPLTDEDVDFLNITSIKFEVFDPNEVKTELDYHDSGWCDVVTGARIISSNHRVAFLDVSPEELTYLTLRYYNRLKPLHNGFRKIYKYKLDID
jgi:hypothetical protein